MYRRRKHFSLGNFLGLLFCGVGVVIFMYIIPFKAWIFLFACGLIIIGILIFQF
ncbi:hypothetical protein [Alkaliphilus peptidifermentans]|uniref:Uncharacterized protein n=1 Tax=Alkaliphilus peptidifermentans DSM 18978 TaxID=1120976 RepID=A0A1G5JA44_9FIRM|nr:hypothetical protein [Alkaliphilus peptidifermentans]SCY85246.1 hypothetical protein SAMN03080606_02746 [Alkaliphilus peptidifermentans DSM 18978]